MCVFSFSLVIEKKNWGRKIVQLGQIKCLSNMKFDVESTIKNSFY